MSPDRHEMKPSTHEEFCDCDTCADLKQAIAGASNLESKVRAVKAYREHMKSVWDSRDLEEALRTTPPFNVRAMGRVGWTSVEMKYNILSVFFRLGGTPSHSWRARSGAPAISKKYDDECQQKIQKR